jgi:hypothetical protein
MSLDVLKANRIKGQVTIEPNETLYDPVSKFRVSQPENLIDTDFEYGLQSTKWETLELVNNIPTFFAREGQTSLNVADIQVSFGSNSVLVTTNVEHGLTAGSVIVVKGASLAFADGTYIVLTVPSPTTFTYSSKAASPVNGSVLELSTEIFNASLYQGTEFKLENLGAIATDGEPSSTITVSTRAPHGFKTGTNFILVNSLTSQEIKFNSRLIEPLIYDENQPTVRMSTSSSGSSVNDFRINSLFNSAGAIDPGTTGMIDVVLGSATAYAIDFPVDGPFKFFDKSYTSVWVSTRSRVYFTNEVEAPPEVSEPFFVNGPGLDIFQTVMDSVSMDLEQIDLMALRFATTAESLRVRFEGKILGDTSVIPTIVWELFFDSTNDEITFSIYNTSGLFFTSNPIVTTFDIKAVRETSTVFVESFPLSRFTAISNIGNLATSNANELTFQTLYSDEETTAVGSLGDYPTNHLNFVNTSSYQPYRWVPQLNTDVRVNRNPSSEGFNGYDLVTFGTPKKKPTLYFTSGKGAYAEFEKTTSGGNYIQRIRNNVITFAEPHDLIDRRPYVYTPGILNGGLVIEGVQRNAPITYYVRTRGTRGVTSLNADLSNGNGIYPYAGSTQNVTSTTAGTNLITTVAAAINALWVGDPVVFNTGIGGLEAGRVYYVAEIANTTQFRVSETPGGDVVTLTSQTLTVVLNVGGIITDPTRQLVLTNRAAPLTAVAVNFGVNSVTRFPLTTDRFGPHAFMAASRIHYYAGANVNAANPGGWWVALPDVPKGFLQEEDSLLFMTSAPTGATLSTNNYSNLYSTFYARNPDSADHTFITGFNGVSVNATPGNRNYTVTGNIAAIAANAETVTVTATLANMFDDFNGFDLSFGSTDVNTTVNTITFSAPHGLLTGASVTLIVPAGNTVPGGLVANTIYFAIVVDSTTIALATTLANANANVRINITSVGDGSTMRFSSFAIGANTTHYVRINSDDTNTALANGEVFDGILTNQTGTTTRTFTIKLIDAAQFAVLAQNNISFRFIGSVDRPFSTFNVSTTPTAAILNLSGAIFDGVVVPIHSVFNNSLTERSEVSTARTWYSKQHNFQSNEVARLNSSTTIVPGGFTNNTYFQIQPTTVDRFRLFTTASAQIFPTNALGGGLRTKDIEKEISLVDVVDTTPENTHRTFNWVYSIGAAAAGATSQTITAPTAAYKDAANLTVPVIAAGTRQFQVTSGTRFIGGAANIGVTTNLTITSLANGCRIKFFNANGTPLLMTDGTPFNNVDIRVAGISGTAPAIAMVCYVISPSGMPSNFASQITNARAIIDPGFPVRDNNTLSLGSSWAEDYWTVKEDTSVYPFVDQVIVDDFELSGIAKTTRNTARISAVSNASPMALTYTYNGANTVTIASTARENNFVTITTVTPHGFQEGQSVTIAGVTDTTFNGTFVIEQVSPYTIRYAQTAANATSVNGTAAQLVGAMSPRVALINSAFTRANPGVATSTAHGLVNRQPFYFVMPPGNSTWSSLYDGKLYYAKFVDANNFAVYKDPNLTIPLDTSAFADGYSTGAFAGSVFALGAKLSFDTPLLTYTARKTNNESDTIFAPAHGLQAGTQVTYSTGGGTEIGGLTAGQTKFVFTPSQDRFRLANDPTGFSTPAIVYAQNVTNMVVSTGVITTPAHGFTTGSIVQYLAAAPATGLENGGFYYVRVLSATTVTLFWTLNGALNNVDADRVPFFTTGSGNASLRQTTIVDLTTLGVGVEHAVSTPTEIGTLDGLYELADPAPGGDLNKFTLSNPNNSFVPKRTISLSSLVSVDLFNNVFNVTGHGLVTGTPVKYLAGAGSTAIATLINEETYFAIKVSNDTFRLSLTQAGAIDNNFITLQDGNFAGTGSHEFVTESIVGAIQAAGTLTLAAGSSTVIGNGTNFTNFYRNGDTFFWAFAPISNTITRTVTFSGSTFTNTSAAPFNAAHFLNTGFSVRWNSTGTAPTGITNGGIYYVRFIAANTFSLHPTYNDALANTGIISVSGGSGTHSVTVLTSGSVGRERIKYVNSATRIVLDQIPDIDKWQKVPVTRITTTAVAPSVVTVSFAFIPPFAIGTIVKLEGTGNAELDGNDFVVTAVATNTITFNAITNLGALTITSPGGNTNTAGLFIYGFSAASFDITSSLLIRSDSASIHRPYDGGVEIVATSSPTAKIIRQTRKYFRYQSGKGIQVSFAINFSPAVAINKIQGLNNGRSSVTTRLPHRLAVGVVINITGDSSNNYSGNYEVAVVTGDYSFEITVPTNTSAVSSGRPEFSVNSWSGSLLRCGVFDDQNGMFFEYDGQQLFCVRRNSTEQIGGTVTVQFGENSIIGNQTDFFGELQEGNSIVIKGQTYKIVNIASPSLMFIQPSYRGINASNVVVSKTQDLRVARPNWSVDPCFGDGPTGYNLNVNRIQMAYLDYSWYGAGKVRMGFKDQDGIVKYVHEFKHNNIEREAYLRSGNLPARYEVEILENPTFVPSLAHWGTSVIMDGRFDVDEAYLFSATSNPIYATSASPSIISVTTINTTNIAGGTTPNVPAQTIAGNGVWVAFDASGTLLGEIGFALQVGTHSDLYFALNANSPITNTSLTPVRTGTFTATPISGRVSSGTYLRDIIVGFNNNGTAIRRNLLVIDKPPANTSTTNGSINVATTNDFTQFIPLVSVRLAPSVDNGTAGELGVREIINRMQLTLNSLDILSTHECEIQLVFNASLDNFNWRSVGSPSLSEVVYHSLSDTITGGSVVYSFQTPSGSQQVVALNASQRELASTTVPLGEVTTLGNSILGGNGVYPDGPDVITVRFRYIGLPGLIGAGVVSTAAAPFRLSTRLSWAESQA